MNSQIDLECDLCGEVHPGSCCLCGDSDHPPWMEDGVAVLGCAMAYGHTGAPKITYMIEAEADAAAAEMRADGFARARHYACPWLLRCDDTESGGGREFPGTEHYHVTSGGGR
jgi:hypothetical protein